MSRPGRAVRAALLRSLIVATVAAATGAVASPALAAGWSRPFTLGPGGAHDDSPLALAYSPAGAAAAAFTTSDSDVAGTERAFLAGRSPSGRVSRARQVSGAAQILSLAYRGGGLQLLVGSTPSGLSCCSAAATMSVSPAGRPGPAHRLVGGLAGATEGRLLSLSGGRMLAVVGTERGLWVGQSGPSGRLGGARRISTAGQQPLALDAAWLGGDRSTIAWTGGTGVAGQQAPRAIDVAGGSIGGGPRRARIAITVPRGHRVDELAVARRAGGTTLLWIESWTDGAGFHSRVEAADLSGRHPRVRALSPANRRASGLTAAGDPGGDQGVAWEACTANASCTVQAAGRGAGHGFGSARTLGPADPTQPPALAISPSGQIAIGWVRGGNAVASVGFGRPTVLSRSADAAGIDVAYGPRKQALAAWSAGTVSPVVQGATFAAG